MFAEQLKKHLNITCNQNRTIEIAERCKRVLIRHIKRWSEGDGFLRKLKKKDKDKGKQYKMSIAFRIRLDERRDRFHELLGPIQRREDLLQQIESPSDIPRMGDISSSAEEDEPVENPLKASRDPEYERLIELVLVSPLANGVSHGSREVHLLSSFFPRRID